MGKKFKKYKITAELFWDAGNIKIIEIKASRPENAKKLAQEKLEKEYKTDMVYIMSIE